MQFVKERTKMSKTIRWTFLKKNYTKNIFGMFFFSLLVLQRKKQTVLPQTESVVCGGSWGAVREEVGCAAGKL